MSRRTTLPIALFLLLAAVALPAPAAPGGFASDLLARAWGWLDRFWSPTANPGPTDRVDGRGSLHWIWAENGSCIDPNGKPAGAGCSAAVWSDGGSCINPDGRPAAGCSAAVQPDNGGCIDPDGKPGAAGCTR